MLERLLDPSRLPNLELIELIGIGGAAEVYRALYTGDVGPNAREVAVKVLSERADPDMVRRFLREGQMLATLAHPHIVTVHYMGSIGPASKDLVSDVQNAGLPYLVMELVEGGSLKERLQCGPLPWREAVQIAIQVADALSYAHQRGIVHRDIKPGNILFTADDVAKLADFGLAYLADASVMTRTGAIMGTVFYLAPEQCLGRHLDGRADLYALGAMIYEMVLGQPPFVAVEEGPGAPISIIYKHLHEQPLSLREHDPMLPPMLDAVVQTLLQKEPERRFADAETLIEALTQVDQPVEAMMAAGMLAPSAPSGGPSGFLAGEGEPTLVGREDILEALRIAMEAMAISDPSPFRGVAEGYPPSRGDGSRMVLLAGEAGMGKSRLIREVLATLQRPSLRERHILALVGECLYVDAPDPYAPFVAMLRSFERQGGCASLTMSDAFSPRARQLRDVVDDLRAILRLEPSRASEADASQAPSERAAWLAQESPRDAQAQLFELWTQFFTLLSQERPLLLVIDDLQWASETAAQLLHYMARSVRHSRILLLGAYRPEDLLIGADEPAPLRETLRRMSREGLYQELVLGPLDTDALAEILAQTLGMDSSRSSAGDLSRIGTDTNTLATLLYRESEGNPFFFLEMLRLLVDEGRLVWQEDHWEPTDDLWEQAWALAEARPGAPLLAHDGVPDALPIPRTVMDLIARRVEALDRETREMLDWAAVLGRRIDIDILALVTGERRMTLLRNLHRLERDHGLVQAIGEGAGSSAFVFRHATVQQALYSELPPSLRRECHLMIGEAIEEAYGAEPEGWIYELARHYCLAHHRAKAYRYTCLAAEQAEVMFALGEALAYLQRAVELAAEAPLSEGGDGLPATWRTHELLNLHGRQGHLLLTMGRLQEALGQFEQALSMAQTLADRRREAEVLLDMAIVRCRSGFWQEALQIAERSLALAREHDAANPEDVPYTAQVLLSMGFFGFEGGDWEYARDTLASALAAVEGYSSDECAAPVSLRARILGNLGILYDARGDHEDAIRHLAAACDTFDALDLPLDQGRALNNLGYAHLRLGHHGEASSCFHQALERFLKVGDVREQAVAYLHLAETHLAKARLGSEQESLIDVAAARRHCVEASQRFARVGYDLGLADVDRVYAGIAGQEGRWAVAERYLRDALAVYEEYRDQLNLAETYAELSDLLDAMGEDRRSREELDRSRTLFNLLLGDADAKEAGAGSGPGAGQP
jgi:predicted ATPase